MIWSIQKFYNEFGIIAASHSEINSYGYGEIGSINPQNQKDVIFPQLWVQAINTQVVLGKSNGNDQRRFILYCYDLTRQDEDNRISVWNTTELILIDVCRLVQYNSNGYKLVNNPILTPFEDRFSDNVRGYMCELVISTPEITGTCFIPGY
jgi:hypothetical protein